MLRTESRRIIEGNVNVNVGDYNPVKIFIGAATIVLLSYWAIQGVFTGLFSTAYCNMNNSCSPNDICSEGMESGTYFLFQLLSGACWLVGSGVFFVWSGLKYLVMDVLRAIRKYNSVNEQRDLIVDQVTQEVTKEALATPPTYNVVGDPIEILNKRINRRVQEEKLSPILEEIFNRLEAVEEAAGVEVPQPPEPLTMESLAETIKSLQEQLEKKTPAKRTTRRTTSKKEETKDA